MSKIKVIVVDDSALIRKILTDLLQQDPGIEVVDTAMDGSFAMGKIKRWDPDVITLDIEMRNVDGITLLKQVMKEHPMPVIMVSALTQKGAETTLRALELGAFDFIGKPTSGQASQMVEIGEILVEKVKEAAAARKRYRRRPLFAAAETPRELPRPTVAPTTLRPRSKQKIIAIGASTGGTEALKSVLTLFPSNAPGAVVVQHMPEKFTTAFAQRLNSVCEVAVKEAEDHDVIEDGLVLIAPGNYHMQVVFQGGKHKVKLDQEPPVCRHRPSVEVLFNSVAKNVGVNAIGVMLTGMGGDGSQAMLKMKNAGAFNIAQNEESCVVFGMPKEAIKQGGVDRVVSLDNIPYAIFSRLQ